MIRKLGNKGEMVTAVVVWLALVVANVGISQLPSVKDNFRRDRAVDICVFTNGTDCEEKVSAMSKEELKDYIRDDDVTLPAAIYYAAEFQNKNTRTTSGGGLRARVLSKQK